MRYLVRALVFLGVLLGGALPAAAQSGCSYIATGAVLTAGQWNQCFAQKQNSLGYTPVNKAGDTMLGRLTMMASTTSFASMNIPHGVAPTSPNNGDIWTTTVGMFVRVNGVTVGPLTSASSASFAGTSPITVSFPSSVVTYAFNFSVSNTFLAAQKISLNAASLPAPLAGTVLQLSSADATTTRITINSFGTSVVPNLTLAAARGTGAVPAAVGNGDPLGSITWNAYGTSAYATSGRAVIQAVATEAWTNSFQGIKIEFYTTPTGGTSTAVAMTIGASGGAYIGAPTGTDEGVGTLNLAGSLYNNGVAPTGTGAYVRATAPSIAGITITSSFTATGLVGNASLVNASTTVNGQVCTLGSSCTITATAASVTIGTTTIASGSTTRILYDNAGVLGEYTITGTGTVVAMQAGPTFSGTVAGNITISGNNTYSGTALFTGALASTGSNGQASLGASSTAGAQVGGKGSSKDLTLANSAGTAVCDVATGTTTLNCATLTLTNRLTSASIDLATNATIGVMRGDTTTISCTAGVCSAIGAAATSIAIGTTTITSGTTNRVLYDNAGVLGELILGNGIENSSGTLGVTAARRTLPTTQSLTSGSSATYTTPANVLWIEVFMVGGGGGGAGTSGSASTLVAGSTGGTSTFNSVNAIGGSGADAGAGGLGGLGGAGGTGGTGTATRRARGSPGGHTQIGSATPPFPNPSGNGGAAYFGGGALGRATSGTGNAGGANSGEGGGGAATQSTFITTGGGGGGGEFVYLIINSPSATYTYTIGASGAGGVGANNTGGAGGTGFIFVIEHYGTWIMFFVIIRRRRSEDE